jgi:hypothetical protein
MERHVTGKTLADKASNLLKKYGLPEPYSDGTPSIQELCICCGDVYTRQCKFRWDLDEAVIKAGSCIKCTKHGHKLKRIFYFNKFAEKIHTRVVDIIRT